MLRELDIPESVRKEAREGLALLKAGFAGGTQTGWNRAHQLAYNQKIPVKDVAVMRAWFARHGPDAKNGGTSYPGYAKWIHNQRPRDVLSKNKYRGAVAWLIWGGDAAYRWLKTPQVHTALVHFFLNKKVISRTRYF